jgi:hypothetical protein
MSDAALDGLATNPALPPGLLRRLIAWRRGFGRVAGRADLTGELVEEMLATDWSWLLTSLAGNRAVAPSVRLRLAGHPDPTVRWAVASGAAGEPDRAAFERLVTDPYQRLRVALAENHDMPADLRARLAGDPDPEVRQTLARTWPDLPEGVRRRLLTDRQETVRAAACATYHTRLPHPGIPADLLPALIADPVTRAGAVRHLTLTAGWAARLAGDPDYEVRRELARHPGLPAGVRDRLASDDSATVQAAVFAREDTPEPLRALIHDEVHRKDAASGDTLLDHPGLEDLDDLAFVQLIEDREAAGVLRYGPLPWVTADPVRHVGSPYVRFRIAAAVAAASLPPGAVRRLLADDDPRVPETVVGHAPHLVDVATAERIERAHRRPSKGGRSRPADSYPFPPEALRRFAADPAPRMRVLGPRDPGLPVEILAALAADPVADVRSAAAAHPRMPASVLVRLLDDADERVAAAAGAHPALPVGAMAALLHRAGL